MVGMNVVSFGRPLNLYLIVSLENLQEYESPLSGVVTIIIP